MTKDVLSDYSTTPGNNTDVAGINIAENCSPANINNAIRELMADLASAISGAARVDNWYATDLNVSGTATIGTVSLTTVSAATLTISGNGTVGGTLGVTGAATLSSTLAVTGAITGSSTITGTAITGERFIVTGSTAPANGIYLPGTNTVGVTTASTLRYSVNASGALGIGSSPDYGTSGQILTSAGSSAVPTWEDPANVSYTPAGTLGAALNVEFPVGAGDFVLKAGAATTGVGGTVTITFASAFPTACVAVIPIPTQSISGTNAGPYVTSISASSCVVAFQRGNGNDIASHSFTWIAVGY